LKLKDRIKGLERIPARDLLPHPKNWRTHPREQRDALRGVLAEVGIADALLVRETPDGYQILDGHCRAEEAPDVEWPCLVVDLSDAEAEKLLITHDPIGAMAEADAETLRGLLDGFETENEAVRSMVEALSEECGLASIESTSMPDLASGDREPFQQMTFTLHDEQAETVAAAIEKAKNAGSFEGSPNENSNGNALARVCEAYL
jgi:hypothetical protein